jgi:hypothetical protein
MDQRQVVRTIAAIRVAVGVVAFVAPRRSAALAFGGHAEQPGVVTIMRSFAARDVALGLGTLRALERVTDPAAWAKLSALADIGDAVTSVIGLRHLPPARALIGATTASLAATLGLRAAPRLG